jgi:hypothetical protein
VKTPVFRAGEDVKGWIHAPPEMSFRRDDESGLEPVVRVGQPVTDPVLARLALGYGSGNPRKGGAT